MIRRPLSLLAALLLALPLGAQSFGDAPAFGGSLVFSEGANPLGNSARFDRLSAGWYAGWEDGDTKARTFKAQSDALDRALQAGDASAVSAALGALQNLPFPLRSKAYGLEYAATGGPRFALSHLSITGLDPVVATGPASVATATRHVDIDRMVTGAGSSDGQSAYGFALRLERVRLGSLPVAGMAPDPALDLHATDRTALSLTADAGYITELAPGLRFGLMATRLVPRHFLDVYEQPQARAGFQLDLGTFAQLSVEGDLNEAARLPMPQKVKTLSASLRLMGTSTVTLLSGAERRTVDGVSSTLLGVSLRIVKAPLVLGLGFQFGNDQPQRALALRIGG